MRRCGVCGNKKLELKNIKGSFHPWKDYSQVQLLLDQDVLVCSQCGNQVFTSMDLIKLDENIAESVKIKVNSAIQDLTARHGLSQENLAIALGKTPEYLSTVKSGKKKLSFTAFNLLMSYQRDPMLITELTGVVVPGCAKEEFVGFIEWSDVHIPLSGAVNVRRILKINDRDIIDAKVFKAQDRLANVYSDDDHHHTVKKDYFPSFGAQYTAGKRNEKR